MYENMPCVLYETDSFVKLWDSLVPFQCSRHGQVPALSQGHSEGVVSCWFSSADLRWTNMGSSLNDTSVFFLVLFSALPWYLSSQVCSAPRQKVCPPHIATAPLEHVLGLNSRLACSFFGVLITWGVSITQTVLHQYLTRILKYKNLLFFQVYIQIYTWVQIVSWIPYSIRSEALVEQTEISGLPRISTNAGDKKLPCI